MQIGKVGVHHVLVVVHGLRTGCVIMIVRNQIHAVAAAERGSRNGGVDLAVGLLRELESDPQFLFNLLIAEPDRLAEVICRFNRINKPLIPSRVARIQLSHQNVDRRALVVQILRHDVVIGLLPPLVGLHRFRPRCSVRLGSLLGCLFLVALAFSAGGQKPRRHCQRAKQTKHPK